MPFPFISEGASFFYTSDMEELIKTLAEIGIPADECFNIFKHFRDDEPGLRHYVLYMRAMYDDRHEYV